MGGRVVDVEAAWKVSGMAASYEGVKRFSVLVSDSDSPAAIAGEATARARDLVAKGGAWAARDVEVTSLVIDGEEVRPW